MESVADDQLILINYHYDFLLSSMCPMMANFESHIPIQNADEDKY